MLAEELNPCNQKCNIRISFLFVAEGLLVSTIEDYLVSIVNINTSSSL
jgi:hypothetical protein